MSSQENKNPNGYDYQALRDKIRQSWGLNDKPDQTAPQTEEKAASRTEPKASVQPKPESKPVQKEPLAHRKAPVLHKTDPAAARKEAAYQAYAERTQNAERRGTRDNLKSQKEDDHKNRKIIMTTELPKRNMARKWVMYQAIFGSPRSIEPWKYRK